MNLDENGFDKNYNPDPFILSEEIQRNRNMLSLEKLIRTPQTASTTEAYTLVNTTVNEDGETEHQPR